MRIVDGREPVAKLVCALFRRIGDAGGTVAPTRIGSQPGVLILDPQGRLFGVGHLGIPLAEG